MAYPGHTPEPAEEGWYVVADNALTTALCVRWSFRSNESVESVANFTSPICASFSLAPTVKRVTMFFTKSTVLS